MTIGRLLPLLLVAILFTSCRSIPAGVPDEYNSAIEVEAYLAAVSLIETCSLPTTPCEITPGTTLVDLAVDESRQTIELEYNELLAYRPIRPASSAFMYATIASQLKRARDYSISITSGGFEISELIPNLYR